MTSNDWQSRLLTDEELQSTLASMGALEGMQVLQRQLELRATLPAPAPEPVVEPEPVIEAVPEPVSPPETLAQPVAPAVDYLPKPVTSNTNSVFVPTFANPVPPAGQQTPPAPIEPVSDSRDATPQTSEVEIPSAVSNQAAWVSSASTEIELPSAEEAITAFEESNTVNAPMPNLVDEVILSVGGQDSEESQNTDLANSKPLPIYAQADASETDVSEQPSQRRSQAQKGSGLGSLISTWNGTGNLLFLIASGFVAGMLKFSLITVLLGAFGALVVTGLGFGTAAVTARRGRQPQATISRAVYGVAGASVPLIFVTIARYAATAVAAIGAVVAVRWYFPALPATVSVSGFSVDIFYPVLAGLLLLAAIATAMSFGTRRGVSLVVAYASIAWVLSAIGLAIWLQPGVFTLGSLNSPQALSLASALLIFISIIWGTTAADETPNLRPDIHGAKLIAVGLVTNTVFGAAAVLAGFVYFSLDLAALKSTAMGVVLTVAVILALSHQLRRTADSFGGFGLVGTRWWVVVGSLVVIAGGITAMHIFVDQSTLMAAVISLLPVVGVPVIAWLASYGVDALLRRENYHEVSLLRGYGFYGKVRVANLIGWVLATTAGLGFVVSDVPGFGWLGYIARPLGFNPSGLYADTGVWIAFAVAALAPLTTLGKIKDQEAEVRALEQRHRELVNVTGEV